MSVCGTDPLSSTFRSFSWQCGIDRSAASEDAASLRVSGLWSADLPVRPPYILRLPIPSDSRSSLLRPSIAPTEKYRNINLSSIDYAFRPRLRVRLTLGGRTLPRKPWISGGEDSHLPYRYSYLHDHLHAVHPAFRQNFNPAYNALLPLRTRRSPRLRFRTLVPIIFGAESLDQ